MNNLNLQASTDRGELFGKIMKELISYGHSYERHVTVEGTVERGPYTLDYKGFRWGRFYLELSPKNEMSIFVNVPRQQPYPIIFNIKKTDYLYKIFKNLIESELISSKNLIKILF